MKGPILFQNQPAVEIRDAENTLVMVPDRGARLLTWQRQGREVITWPDEADWNQILKVRGGNPVLFPFIARHFVKGENELWCDQEGVVRRMPQHGFARDARFILVEEASTDSVRMRLTDSEQTRAYYPFAFQFDVVVTLQAASRVELRFEMTNTGHAPLPYDAGHHFYLAIPQDQRRDWALHLPCAGWGRQNQDGSIVHTESTAEVLHLDDPALIDRFQIQPLGKNVDLLNEKTGQRLTFELASPGSVPWYAVTTWTETALSDFYCVEPWLGLPNAIHHGEGLRHLAPGLKETATCVLDASGW